MYTIENDLLDKPLWKKWKQFATRQNIFKAKGGNNGYNINYITKIINQAKIDLFRTPPKYKYGCKVPRNYKDSIRLDNLNGNTRWVDARKLEFEKLKEYKVFRDKGDPKRGAKYPAGYINIRIHAVYDVKDDGRHQA